MRFWKQPPTSKIYEALGAVADDRLDLVGSNKARCYSSSGNKYYEINYDPEQRAIMVNDNASYYNDYLGYPAIAFLFAVGVLEYRREVAGFFAGVPWKDLNQKHKNDFDRTVDYIFESIPKDKHDDIKTYVSSVALSIEKLELKQLGPKVRPPEGY